METTIAAISTAMSASGIGIIRISGENAMDVEIAAIVVSIFFSSLACSIIVPPLRNSRLLQ